MSSRLSLGGGSSLRDSSSRMNSRSSRRQSHGGALTATPQKDRRAMLDEWRRQTKTEESSSSAIKREREESPDVKLNEPLAAPEGTTALERYRMRKQQKMLLAHNQYDENNVPAARPPLLPPSRPAMAFEDDEVTSDYGRSSGSHSNSGTPSFSRRLTSSGRARRRSYSVGGSHRRPPRDTLSQESQEPECKLCSIYELHVQ